VLVGIHDASHKTGVNFTYMLAKANQESGFRPDATNPRGTASGLFQFTRTTWLDQIARHGEKHGLGELSRQIYMDTRGRLHGDTPEVERQILALRADPRVSAMMAAEYAAENKAYLEHCLGRSANVTDVYLAHFLGPGGAVTFLKGMASDPDAPAARYLPQAAASNPTIFNHDGQPRSLRQVHAVLRATINDAMRRFSGVSELTEARTPPQPPEAKPDAPPPAERGWGVAGEPPLAPPGRRPDAPAREDLIPLHLAALPPADPGARPMAPDRATLMSPEMAAAMPPVPGPRPDPAALRGAEPRPADGPDPGRTPSRFPETRVAEASPALPPIGSAVGDSVVARVLTATRAVEEAGAARKLDLPGPSAIAMAAMLDNLFGVSTEAPSSVLVLDPVAGLTRVSAVSGMEAPADPTSGPPSVLAVAGTDEGTVDPGLDEVERRAAESLPMGPSGPVTDPSPALEMAAVMSDETTRGEATAGAQAAITRILAVGESVSSAPGEAGVSMAVPRGPEPSSPSDRLPNPLVAALTRSTSRVDAASAGARSDPDRPRGDLQANDGGAPERPAFDPAVSPSPLEPRWRTAAVEQLATSEVTQAISAILGRPSSG